MTDQPSVPIPPEPAESAAGAEPAASAAPETLAGPSAGEAWSDVIARLGELGDALSAWAKAATDSPENRKHLDEVRSGVNDMARQANDAFSAVASSDFGRQVTQGATQVGQQIGDTAQEFGQAAAPHVASAFAGLADAFGRAAEKVGETVAPPRAPKPPTDATPTQPAAPTESEPPVEASWSDDDAKE